MIKSFKVMLIPNKKQETRFYQYAGTARFVYNWALRRQMENFEAGEGFLSNGVLRKELTAMKQRPESVWMYGLN